MTNLTSNNFTIVKTPFPSNYTLLLQLVRLRGATQMKIYRV